MARSAPDRVPVYIASRINRRRCGVCRALCSSRAASARKSHQLRGSDFGGRVIEGTALTGPLSLTQYPMAARSVSRSRRAAEVGRVAAYSRQTLAEIFDKRRSSNHPAKLAISYAVFCLKKKTNKTKT